MHIKYMHMMSYSSKVAKIDTVSGLIHKWRLLKLILVVDRYTAVGLQLIFMRLIPSRPQNIPMVSVTLHCLFTMRCMWTNCQVRLRQLTVGCKLNLQFVDCMPVWLAAWLSGSVIGNQSCSMLGPVNSGMGDHIWVQLPVHEILSG